MADLPDNRCIIEANNRAIEALRTGGGNLVLAYEKLAFASNSLHEMPHVHQQPQQQGATVMPRFQWSDCTRHLSGRMEALGKTTNEGSAPLVCLRFLTISLPLTTSSSSSSANGEGGDEDVICCPCTYSWAIWYNLAIVCTLVGARLGVKGHGFLKHAYQSFQRVLLRAQVEPKLTCHWYYIRLAALNNQACICRIIHRPHMLFDRLLALAATLGLDFQPRKQAELNRFYLTLQILRDTTFVAAAA